MGEALGKALLAGFLMIGLLFGCATTRSQTDSSQSISQIQFSRNWKKISKATIGDKIKIKATSKNIPDGSSVVISVFEKYHSDEFVEVQKLYANVKNNQIKTEWTVDYVFGEHNSVDYSFTESYKCPEYFFIAEYEDCKSEPSEPLQLYANYYAKPTFKDRILVGYPYVLKLADGSYRKGKTNKKGLIIEKEIPIGRVRMM